MNKDVAIFIDTNIAQTFIGENVYFSKLGIPSQYYELTTFIEENRLNGRIEICFPETVVKEMKSHMIKGFVSANNAIVESICGFKKNIWRSIGYRVSSQNSRRRISSICRVSIQRFLL